MIKFLVKRPIAVFMTFFAFMLLGISSLNLIPVSLMPEIGIPYLKIQIEQPNYSSKELEKLVVKPIRRQLLQVSNLNEIESKTFNGKALIDLTFEYGTDIDYAFIEVNEKIDRILNILPKEINRPKLIKFNPSDVPLFYVNIPYPDNQSQINFSNYIKNTVRKRLEQNESIAYIDITGTVSPEISITLKTNKLNIAINEIEQVIKNNNTQLGSFKIKNGHYVYDILFEPSLKTISDIKNLYIESNNTRIQIKDIADVLLTPKERKGYYFSNGRESIGLSIVSKTDAKVENVKREVITYLDQINKNNTDLVYSISQDQSKLLNISINNLKNSLITGALLAILMVYLFIRNYKISLLIALVIPFSLIISFLFLYIINISINIVSLSGLIIGIGMMIDNSIIIIDNISQYRIKGYSIIESCNKGIYEILRPLLSSILTTCAVFIPLIYLSGISGILFFDQALAIIISLTISYLVSILLLPTLYVAFRIKIKDKPNKTYITALYSKSFNFFFKRKKLILIGLLGVIFFGIFMAIDIKKEKIPKISYNDFNLIVNWNENIGIQENKRRALDIGKYANNTNTYIGEQDFLLSKHQDLINDVKFYINSNSHRESEILKTEICSYLDFKYPNAIYTVKDPDNLFEQIFSNNKTYFFLKIPLKHSANIQNIIKDLENNFSDIKIGIEHQKKIINLSIDLKKLTIYNVDNDLLISELKMLFKSSKVSILKSTNEYIPIVIKKMNKDFFTIINTSYILNRDKVKIPISSLISVNQSMSFEIIHSDSDANYIPVTIAYDQKEELMNYVKTKINNEIEFDGAFFEKKAFMSELIMIMIIVVLLLYFVLAAQFESLLQPIIILCEIPITIAGTIIIMSLINVSLNIMSMIGMIIMLGIVVNDSILKIDTINKLKRKNDIPLIEAIHIAGQRRLNAILMTSFTTILAMVPILLAFGIGADLQRPLSLVVIVSMIIGTFVSLYIVPMIYWILIKH
ncbi:efflux RND transporter permease subunit [Flavivirga abyssicola]|uniref:efflux RND transporter permease subunit n=1 Tax=Flavivirga abyssicola TaxID=3063533 RepID=UPI0026E01F12|nr:efflux RND transporter permease subunit [Flavivirga sp. MEBiC07777]WVK14185.1 efflux RND transporter permease subunit [Flavivirga sp. MEBiC07777]